MDTAQKPQHATRQFMKDQKTSTKRVGWNRGFALIVTIMTLSLLLVLVLALTSLAQSDTRTSSHVRQKAIAENNALMGLKNAIGELQLSLGPDQMISANAEILSDPLTGSSEVIHPKWLGAWRSWSAGEPDPSLPAIDQPSDHQTIPGVTRAGMHPTYISKRQDHFKNWLVSLTREEAATISTPMDLVLNGGTQPNADSDAVCLVDTGTLGSAATENDKVRVRLIDVQSDANQEERQGRYGWWIGDESQKARILGGTYESDSLARSLGDALFRQQAPATTGTKVVNGLENVAADARLSGLQSLQTINLVNGVAGKPSENFHHITTESYGVLSDVREGGLKRDLSTLLERPIDIGETDDRFMLYRFDNDGQEQVPIQDLSAYYQLYDNDPNWSRKRRGGVQNNSSTLKLECPDYGGAADTNREKYLRQYTSLYTNPVPIKIQFLLAMAAEEITQAERDALAARPADKQIRASDTHKLVLGVMPVVTLWNPSNLPMVMNNAQCIYVNTPTIALRWKKYRPGEEYTNDWWNLNYAMGSEPTADGRAKRLAPHLIKFRFARAESIVFEPGEVKQFSLPATAGNGFAGGSSGGLVFTDQILEPVNEWDPFGFFVTKSCATAAGEEPDAYASWGGNRRLMVFSGADSIAPEISCEGQVMSGRAGRKRPPAGMNISPMNDVWGAGFNFYLLDNDFTSLGANRHHFRHYQFMSRFAGGSGIDEKENALFNRDLMIQGFPGKEPIPFDSRTNATPGSQIIAATQAGEIMAFMQFSMMAGCETGALALGGYGGGRRNTTRPFLHGGIIAPPFLDQADTNSLYNYGWEWQVDRINAVEDSCVQGKPGTGYGYFGGGYTIEAGTTHVVQQDIPVAPPISIASLSHAHLGGFSLADAPVALGKNDNVFWKDDNYQTGPPGAFQQVTATGQGGLAPHVMQAIGNSYAHPNIPADLAYTTWSRHFDNELSPSDVTFADHSYLANKALWDEFFFSSITPQPSSNPIFDNGGRTVEQVASDFFFGDSPLPNSRMHPVTSHMDEEALDSLFGQKDDFTGGLADQIAAHLMVEGAFNINSTSTEAWKIFLSSLRGKSVAKIDKDGKTGFDSIAGVPVGPGNLAAGLPVTSESITSPNQPEGQWNSWREITDQEIEQLAVAIVKQVKLRGPFLSLSEFVNRRLDSANREFSAKGALQAALDDPEVYINAGFRNAVREFSDAERNAMTPAFAEALEGPVAYGSAAYVDQADVLRHFGGQLTPRGDTFVIRSYGDALDPTGKVTARAWCEAVVQRMPEYVDGNDDPHLSPAELPATSVASRRFGRKLEVVSFRWLHPSEL